MAGEWALGDLACEHCENVLTSRTRPAMTHVNAPLWTEAVEFYKHFIAFYHARVESVIHRVKSHAWCAAPFRGSYVRVAAETRTSRKAEARIGA